jgi:hypothetical protein
MVASKRELIQPHKGTRGNVGRSLAADRRTHAKKTVKPGQGDRGDVKR